MQTFLFDGHSTAAHGKLKKVFLRANDVITLQGVDADPCGKIQDTPNKRQFSQANLLRYIIRCDT